MNMEKILIVDNSANIRNFCNHILKVYSFESMTTENGLVAYEKLLSDEFSIIIIETSMTKLNYYELIEKIKKLKIETSIIVVSTKDEQKEILKGIEAGANIFIIKPTILDKFVNILRKLLEKRVCRYELYV